VHHINHHTQSSAVTLGIGSSVTQSVPLAHFDWHAGIQETAIMQYLYPHLVRLEQASKPVITMTPKMLRLYQAIAKHPSMEVAWQTCFTTDPETGKGGSSRELSNTGAWCLDDPASGTAEYGRQCVERIITSTVDFILAWEPIR